MASKIKDVLIDEKEIDVLAAPTPGQSLTATPGQLPYEKPPLTVEPKEATNVLVSTMQEPANKKSIAKLLDIGLSAQTLASSYVVGGVSEGLFDVDVAEIIKPALIFYIVEIGEELGVQDMNVLDEAPAQGLDEFSSMDLMSKVSPDRFKKRYGSSDEKEETQENMPMMEQDANMPMMQQETDMPQGFINQTRGEEI